MILSVVPGMVKTAFPMHLAHILLTWDCVLHSMVILMERYSLIKQVSNCSSLQFPGDFLDGKTPQNITLIIYI